MRKTNENGHFFAAWNSLEKLVVNLADSNHGWRETVICVCGATEAAIQKDHSVLPTAWNQGVLQHGGVSVTTKVQEKVECLL